jgi:hypothetical protein
MVISYSYHNYVEHSLTITILDIIHPSVSYLEHNILGTGFCLRLQVEPTPSPDTSNNTKRIYKAKTTQTTNESYHFHTSNLHTCGAPYTCTISWLKLLKQNTVRIQVIPDTVLMTEPHQLFCTYTITGAGSVYKYPKDNILM